MKKFNLRGNTTLWGQNQGSFSRIYCGKAKQFIEIQFFRHHYTSLIVYKKIFFKSFKNKMAAQHLSE